MKGLKWRLIFISLLTLLSVYTLVPSIIYLREPTEHRNDAEYMAKKIPSWLPKSHLNLGLDLQGGVQLVLGVNLDQAVENRLGRMGTELQRWSEDKKLGVKNAYVVKGENRLHVEFEPNANADKFKDEFRKEFSSLESVKRQDNWIEYAFKADQIATIKGSAIEQAERVVRSRVDKWGVTEPLINRRADNTIMAQLPGFKDPEKAKELLGRTAQLKFKIVDDEFKGFDDLIGKLPPEIQTERGNGQTVLISEDREAIRKLTAGKIPSDHELVFSRESVAGGAKSRYRTYVVKAAAEVTGDDVMDASVVTDTSDFDQRPAVQLHLTAAGGKRFADVTGNNVHKRMAIILDDNVESAPVINQKIAGGVARITLGSGVGYNELYEQAKQLSLVLKSGALPASIDILEQWQVGASLGPELAREGILGVLLGLALVYGFMLFFYRRPGLIACAALLLNALYLMAMMVGFGFALTLPGIAGFVLSLGMAVDANVLINERIREEMRAGKNPRKALENGFGRVFWTVFDSHITTLLAGFILLETNTSGPIRGFAITLIIGLIISLFTALYCSRLLFDVVMSRNHSEQSIKHWMGAESLAKFKVPNFNFLHYDIANTSIAGILAVAIIGFAAVKGFNWSVDFVGGTEVEVTFAENVKPSQLHDAGKKAGIDEVTIQALQGGEKQFLLRFDDSGAEKGQPGGSKKVHALQEIIRADFASVNPQITRVDYVGPQIGKELRNQGFISLFYAIVGVMLYLALRFDIRFGTGAVIKLIPDTCFMLGFYLFFWRSFDLTSVAALLTGIGYSVSDVIVVYDRIRENIQTHPKRSLRENINISLNETLARTIKVSGVTLMSLVGILVFGTGSIRNFAFAMSVGIIGATLTSNFVGSTYLLWIDKFMRTRNRASGQLSATRAAGLPQGQPAPRT